MVQGTLDSFSIITFFLLLSVSLFLHKFIYSSGIKRQYQAAVPVVIVGNLTVGGTGKTPLVIELVQFLQKNNYKPGIISRGYKGKEKKFPKWVLPSSDPKLVGDEPVLISKKTGCPVVIAPKRGQAIAALLAGADCDVIIGDDGLQHHGLKRTIEIVIVDGERGFGNGFCLPAGPLREPITRLSTVDFIIETNTKKEQDFGMRLIPEEIVNIVDHTILDLNQVKSRTIHAVAGIGHPDRFFNLLITMGLSVIKHPFPDHYQYRSTDFSFCKPSELIIMTEKDAIKCKEFATKNFWMLPVRPQLSQQFLNTFLEKLHFIRDKK